MGKFYKIRGKDLYTEILGDKNKNPLLFIHGGPGGIGISDFIKYQGNNLSKSFKVIAVEQRGVFRSEAISDEEEITLEDIILDFEELRKKLNIERWSILSHSFGGYLAAIYANLYPDSINYMIFENPTFDFSLSERSMLEAALKELKSLGNDEFYKKYYKAFEESGDYKKINTLLMKVLKELGENCNNIMWYGKDKNILEKIVMTTEGGSSLWQKSTKTRNIILKDWRVYTDVFNELSNINKPCLLIKGKYDPITCQTQLKEFTRRVKDNKVIMFNYSGHYARIEEPCKYSKVITDFISNCKL